MKKIIYAILGVLQIIGFVFILLYTKGEHPTKWMLVLIGIGGIAAPIKLFFPSTSESENMLRFPAAMAGIGTLVFAIVQW